MAVLLVWPALPGPAQAQAQTPAQAPAQLVAPAGNTTVQDEKSLALALALPLTGMGAGILMVSIGFDRESYVLLVTGTAMTSVLGPSLGHLYAGETRNALVQIGVRVGAYGIFMLGAQWLYEQEECWSRHPEANGRCAPDNGDLLMLGGLAVAAVSTVYSLVDAPFAAHRHNVRARRQQILLTPAPVVGPDHTTGLGLHLSGRF